MKCITWVVLAMLASWSALAQADTPLEFGKFGKLAIYQPAAEPSGVAIFVSDTPGWNPATAELAKALLPAGAVVLGVDLPHYLAQLGNAPRACALIGADFEALSHRLQKQLGLRDYQVPILVGSGAAGALLESALATAPFDTFAGAIYLGRRELKAYACRNPRANTAAAGVLRTRTVGIAGGATAAATAARLASSFQQLRAQAQPPRIDSPQVSDLPLTVVPAIGRSGDTLTVLLTGDGGWAGIDQQISAAVAQRGIPVVGFNTLKYFWQPHSPDEVAAAVARVLRHYLTAWNAEHITFVGYSFGADVMPFVISRLPGDLRARIRSVSLLGLSEYASFEVHVVNWLPGFSAKDSPVLPELAKLKDLRVLCVYGEGEADTLCPQLQNAGIRALRIGKGHHFSGEYATIAEAILGAGIP